MTTFSKFYKEHIQPRTCQDFLHSETCREHLTRDILLYIISNLKYFAPICLLPALVNIRKLNKKELRKTLEYYIDCSLKGAFIGYFINFLICFLRHVRGQFGFYTFLFVPAYLTGYLQYWGSSRVINIFETTIFQCSIEAFFLMRRNIISRTIANSKLLQTWIFMLCSAIILHGKQMYNTQGFWLLSPNPRLQICENTQDQGCELHPQKTCRQYLFDGLRKYFILGLTLDSIKILMSKTTSSQDQSKFVGKLRNFRIRSMAVLAAYIGIYRFAHCWLNRKGFYSDLWNHILSSFFAGSCYYLYPQSTLFSFTLVQTIRTLWKIFEISNRDTKYEIIKLLLKIPYSRLLFPIALGNMIHLVAIQPKYISRLAATIFNGVANNYPKHIQNQIEIIKKQTNFQQND